LDAVAVTEDELIGVKGDNKYSGKSSPRSVAEKQKNRAG